MGFLKVRQIYGEQRIYWCVRKRQSKKLGGNGKVVSIEYYLGDNWYSLKNLSWYVWDVSINLTDFLDKFVKWYLADIGYNVDFYIRENDVYFRSKDKGFDLRSKDKLSNLKRIRYHVKSYIDQCLNFDRDINSILKTINLINDFIDSINDIKDKMIKDRYLIEFYNYYNDTLIWLDDLMQNEVKRLLDNKVPKRQYEYAKKRILGYCYQKCPLKQLIL